MERNERWKSLALTSDSLVAGGACRFQMVEFSYGGDANRGFGDEIPKTDAGEPRPPWVLAYVDLSNDSMVVFAKSSVA